MPIKLQNKDVHKQGYGFCLLGNSWSGVIRHPAENVINSQKCNIILNKFNSSKCQTKPYMNMKDHPLPGHKQTNKQTNIRTNDKGNPT